MTMSLYKYIINYYNNTHTFISNGEYERVFQPKNHML